MATSRRVNQSRQIPSGASRRQTRSVSPGPKEISSPEAAEPEADLMAMEGIDRFIPGFAGNGIQISMDAETRSHTLLAMQQALGNQSVQRIVQRQVVPPASATATTPAASVPTLPEDLRAFRTRGATPADLAGTPIVPSTGMGGFNARYDPATMVLTIKLNIGMNFLDGMTINGDEVAAVEASMDRSAIRINEMLGRLSGERRTLALAQIREQWMWSGPNDSRITTWMADYRANVMGAWSSARSGIIFQGSRTGWETQLARVNVVVNTQNITSVAPGAPIPGPQPVHCQADIYKTPDIDVFGANVDAGSGTRGDDQVLQLGSGQVSAQSHLLTKSVSFANNSSILSSKAQERLRKWIISFQAVPGTPGSSISITGHANTKGEETAAGRNRNLELSLARAAAVENYLKTTSVEGSLLRNASTRINNVAGEGAVGSGEEAGWRKVDIVVANGQGQNIAAHEFGHMIGLDDEYASTPERDRNGKPKKDENGDEISRGLISGTGGDVGSTSGHNALATEMGLGGSVRENNANIMSLGSTILPQHYATFMSALHTISGINDWRVKT
jgi:outer membrane protein OmpA-like peptidoglycan-associated protein